MTPSSRGRCRSPRGGIDELRQGAVAEQVRQDRLPKAWRVRDSIWFRIVALRMGRP
jgi:hypothetical protein